MAWCREKHLEVRVLDRFNVFVRRFEFDRAPRCPSLTGMDEERFETTEAVGNLFVEHWTFEHFSALNLVAVEAADRSKNGIDATLAESTDTMKQREYEPAVADCGAIGQSELDRQETLVATGDLIARGT
jgi:hypothetical protein